jgi:hypothetical protein
MNMVDLAHANAVARSLATALASAIALSVALSACGGGGSDATSSTCRPTMANPDLCGVPTVGGATGIAALKLTLTDKAGALATQVSPENVGTLQAVVKDGSGAGVANTAVTFTSTDKTGVFIPTSGTALTDATGLAQVKLPAGTQAGGFTVTASAVGRWHHQLGGHGVERQCSVCPGAIGELQLAVCQRRQSHHQHAGGHRQRCGQHRLHRQRLRWC